MSIVWANNASTTIVGAVSPSATQVTVSPGTGVNFPNPAPGNHFVATFYDQATKTHNEIVWVTARDAVNTDLFTIVRAQEGTTAQTWNTGDVFSNLITAGQLATFQQAGPLNTEIVYVGTDVSTIPNLIVCPTSPVPGAYAVGMLFNIKIANTNTGAVSPTNGGGMQLNGLAAVQVTRTDGSDLVAGNLVAGEEMTFIYNGTNPGGNPTFMALIGPYLVKPPTNFFYVSPSGNDSNDGLSPAPSHAFRTISGAMAAISSRYISQSGITLSVANGTYFDSPSVSTTYISNWLVIGNQTSPGSVLINATSTIKGVSGGYPDNSFCNFAWGFATGGSAVVTVVGLTFESAASNVGAGGNSQLTIYDCNFTAPTAGWPVFYSVGGKMSVYSNYQCNYSGATAPILFNPTGNGTIALGYNDGFTQQPLLFNFTGSSSFSLATVFCEASGTFGINNSVVSSTYGGTQPPGKKFICQTAGGIYTDNGDTSTIPGQTAGQIIPPGWTQ